MKNTVNAETPGKIKAWVSAFRLRTLPLSLSSIFMGGFLAASQLEFDPTVLMLCILTTLFLQILSNLANDYGDSVHGADHAGRLGPKRAVQAGHITKKQMKAGFWFFILLRWFLVYCCFGPVLAAKAFTFSCFFWLWV